MAVLIDTSVLIEFEREGGSQEFWRAAGGEQVAISVITVSELLHGVHRSSGKKRAKRAAMVEHVLASTTAMPITETIARTHAELSAQLSDSGTPVGAHDLWIAASAVAGGFGVLTSDERDFDRIPGLRVVGFERGVDP